MSNAKTAPSTTASFMIVHLKKEDLPATVGAEGLVGADIVDIQVLLGDTFTPSGFVLDTSEPARPLIGPGTYKINKGTTGGSVALTFSGKVQNPGQIEVG